MCSARHAAAAADDLGALLAPLEGELGVRRRADLLVEAPARAGQVAEVGIDAERQLGEVPEPGDHPRHVVDRQAVDEQRADPHLLEPPGRPPEEIAFGRAPVLSEHPADAVAAASEREPDGKPGLEQPLDGLERLRVAHERQRLEQDEVRRLLGKHAARAARCVPRRCGELTSSEIANATAHSFTRSPSSTARRASRMPRRATSIQCAAPPSPDPGAVPVPARTGSTRCRSRARCNPRPHRLRWTSSTACGARNSAHVPHSSGSGAARGAAPLQLRGHAAVEDDAALGGEHLLEPAVRRGRGRRARSLDRRAQPGYSSVAGTSSGCASKFVICLNSANRPRSRAASTSAVARCRRPRSRTTRRPSRTRLRAGEPRR